MSRRSETGAAGLTGAQLKIIAMLCMLTDHIGAALVYPLATEHPQWAVPYYAMRAVGRLAFPIYCFLLTEGFIHTGSRTRYLARLALFALISELPFDLLFSGTVFDPGSQNVFFTLTIAMAVLWALERYGKDGMSRACIAAIGGAAAFLLRGDYGWLGVALTTVLYLFRQDWEKRRVGVIVTGIVIYPNPFCVPFLCFLPLAEHYSGRQGRKLGLWMYWFYPVHLLALKGLQLLLYI